MVATLLLENALPINPSDLVNIKLELSRIRRARARMLEAVLQSPDLRS